MDAIFLDERHQYLLFAALQMQLDWPRAPNLRDETPALSVRPLELVTLQSQRNASPCGFFAWK